MRINKGNQLKSSRVGLPRPDWSAWREANKSVLQELGGYAGRLVLITDPGDQTDTKDDRQTIAEVVATMMPAETCFRFSVHPESPSNEDANTPKSDIYIAASMLRSALGVIVGETLVDQTIVSHVRSRHLNIEALAMAARQTIVRESDLYTVHIAVVQARGLGTVNLDSRTAHSGNSFWLLGITSDHRLQWESIYQNPQVGSGPHHLE